MPKGERLIQRFMKNVSPTPTDTGCRLWIGYRNKQGYGRLWFEGGFRQAHALAALAYYGPPPPDCYATCHKCDKPACVNPAHLFYGTARDNALDCVAKGRHGYQRNIEAHSRRLSKPVVMAIYSSRLANGEVARKYGVSPATVCDIQQGRTWKWFTGGAA